MSRTTSIPDGAPLPHGWGNYVHPEGNTYYYNPETRVVSDTDPRRYGVIALFSTALERIHDQLSRHVEAGSFEVYLSLSDRSTPVPEGVVEYYVVDYKHRSIFWVDDVNIATDLAGSVDQFESMEQLRLSLEPEFWTHVECYPCHQGEYDHKTERELTAVLRHGCVDDTTAPGSVFPYSADESLRYLKLLERFHRDDESTESYRRRWTAHLLARICGSRYINRYGLPRPRVDRLQDFQSYLAQHTRESTSMAFGEALCFGMSKRTFLRLMELWNGRIIYQRHWQPFLEQQRLEWRWTALGNSYISVTESLDHGLRPLSIAFTLPKALLGYGMIVFGGNAVHRLASQLQNEPVQMLYMTTAATAIPLVAALFLYRIYGPAAP
ncbi:hypothetical protein FRC00_004092 [Tulasnella sp. 408]|nr:hypothetical protein FRC00_004092 [Tulasnella sp. 408]